MVTVEHISYEPGWLPDELCSVYRMQQMRQSNISALQTQRMPTTRNEAYRYFDVSPVLKSTFQVMPCFSADCFTDELLSQDVAVIRVLLYFL